MQSATRRVIRRYARDYFDMGLARGMSPHDAAQFADRKIGNALDRAIEKRKRKLYDVIFEEVFRVYEPIRESFRERPAGNS